MRPANKKERKLYEPYTLPGYVANPHYSQEDWDVVSDNPELTEEDFAKARPFAEVFPYLLQSIRRARGRPALANPRKHISLRLDPDVIEKFRATGKGWQGRINEVLKQAKIG
jgi:uncharacterized protein (DUF4415 family)